MFLELVCTAARRLPAARRLAAWLALAAMPASAWAADANGNFVWFDERNSALLLECVEGGCAAIPSAKPGETYTFIVPAALRAAAAQLKEGQKLALSYEDRKEGGYVIVALK